MSQAHPSPVDTARPAHDAGSVVLSQEQFADLFRTHARAMWVIAAAVLSDGEGAKDVVQEAAIIALRKRGEFEVGSGFAQWMGQIVRYVALNELRRRRTREGLVHGARTEGGAKGNAPGGAGVSRLGQVIPMDEAFDDRTLRALAELEESARACLLMKTVLDMPYRQISETLGIPENTAMSHVHRARKRMRALMEGADASAQA